MTPSAASEQEPQPTPAIDTTGAAPGTAAPSAPVQQPGGQQQLVGMCVCVEGCWHGRFNWLIGPARPKPFWRMMQRSCLMRQPPVLAPHPPHPTQSATGGGTDGPNNKPGGGYFKSAPRDATHGMMEGVKTIARAYKGRGG